MEWISDCLVFVFVMEVHCDLVMVSDAFGEFIELYNAGEGFVFFCGWVLIDLYRDWYEIDRDVIIEGGYFLVIG